MLRLCMLIGFLFVSVPVMAQDNVPANLDDLPPLDARVMEEGAPISLSPDGPAVIHLDRDAASVIIGNPNHASAIMENPRLIMLMPGQPGATKVMALDREGKAILNRHVLVGGGKSGFMRVNRVCAVGQKDECAAQSVYYCPDRCYETTITASEGSGGSSGGMAIGPAPSASVADPVSDAASNGVVQ